MTHSWRTLTTSFVAVLSALGLVACSAPKPTAKGCTTDSQCGMGNVCKNNQCVEGTTPCVANTTVCDGSKVMKCNADGTTLSLQTVCSTGCDGGMCQTNTCTPGDQQCDMDGKSIDRCSADGTHYDPVSVCELGCDSATSACKGGICRPGARQCTPDGQIQTCDPTGAMWTTAPCTVGDGGTNAICVTNGLNGASSSAWCEQTSCTPGAVRCDGLTVVQCDSSGSGETQVTACDSACDQGQCGTTMCQPGTLRCSMDGTTLQRCNDLGTGYDSQSCAVNGVGVCVANPGATGAQGARCAQALCQAGTAWCDGDQIFQCSADGLSETAVQNCLFGCSSGTCANPACTPGQQRCDGNTLEQCEPDQRGFISQQYCLSGCVSSGPGTAACSAQVCAPFDARCSDSSTLERCRADGTGWDDSTCGQNMVCKDGSCVAQQPQCVDGSQRCNGGQIQVCESVDGSPLSYHSIGGCLGSCSGNTCDSAGQCGPFGLSIPLVPAGTNLPGDGQSTFLVLSDPLVAPDGSAVPDGTLITVAVGAGGAATPPALLSADEDPATPGLQVPVIDGRIDFLVQAPALSIGTLDATIQAQIGTHTACGASLSVTFDSTITDRYVGDDFSTTRERDSQKSSSNWDTKRGVVTVNAFDAGDGRDGPLVVAAGQTVDLSTRTSNGHSYPDMASGQVQSISEDHVYLTGDARPFSQPGTRVMLINLQAPPGQVAAVGAYEFATVQGFDGAALVLTTPVTRVYGPTDNTSASLQNQLVRIIRVPQYSTVQVAGTLTGPAFDGKQGGVLTFFAQSAATAANNGNVVTGTITMKGKGYRGASTPPNNTTPLTGEGVEGGLNTTSTVGGVGVSGGGYCCGTGDIVPSSMPAKGGTFQESDGFHTPTPSSGEPPVNGNIAPGTPLPPDNVTYAYFGSGGSYATQGKSSCATVGPGAIYGDSLLSNIYLGGGSGSVSRSSAHSCYVSKSCCRIASGSQYAGQCATQALGGSAFSSCSNTSYCDAISYIWDGVYSGQPGGGIIAITAGALTLSGSGSIDASGVNATGGGYGSAGGSVYLRGAVWTLGGPSHVTAAGGNGGGDGRIRIDAAKIDMGFTPAWTTPAANFVQQAPSLVQSLVVLNLPMGYAVGTGTVFPAGVAVPTKNGALDPVASYAATGLTMSLSEDSGSTWGPVPPGSYDMSGNPTLAPVNFGQTPAAGMAVKWQLVPIGGGGATRGLQARFTLQ